MKVKIYLLIFCLLISVLIRINAQTIHQIWGMCAKGGTNDFGTIYNTDTNGNKFKLNQNFTNTGFGSYSSLLQATNGKLYGMTIYGGIYGLGVLFEYDTVNGNYIEKVNFSGGINGANPYGSLIQASNGKLYGMTSAGGLMDDGILFEYDINTNTFTKKIDFLGTSNGANPYGNLYQVSNGKLYGMTSQGGLINYGILFEYDINSNTLTKKIDFIGKSNGAYPSGTLIQATNGKLYGTTSGGGTSANCNYGCGVLFEYDTSLNTLTKKIDFKGKSNGSYPSSALIQANNGKLYGTTSRGGLMDFGVLFNYDIVSDTLIKNIDFNTTIGTFPTGTLIRATNGKLYGMTEEDGYNGRGTIFEYNINSDTIIDKYNFGPPSSLTSNGYTPLSPLMQASNGKLYGTTVEGGLFNSGQLFQYDIISNNIIKLIDFGVLKNGGIPNSALLQASNKKLYGTTNQGGINNLGVLFEYDINSKTLIKDTDFININGANPTGSLIQASNEKLYGMTYQGGNYDDGVLYEFNIYSKILTKEIEFQGNNGANPYGSLLQANNGKLYGLTTKGGLFNNGVLFEYDTSSNTLTKKIDFNGNNGANPNGSLIQSKNGKLYGLTVKGGSFGNGVLFEYDINTNTMTKKIDFLDSINGTNPYGSLIQIKNGKLYGLTSSGGFYNQGVLFECDSSLIAIKIKHNFYGNTNGSEPHGTLIQSPNGKLYGTAPGGIYENGILFKYDIIADTFIKIIDFQDSTKGENPTDLSLISVPCPFAFFSIQSKNQIKCTGQSAIFSVSTSGKALSYQWKKNGNIINGATDSNYIITSVSINDTGKYSCYACNDCGCLISNPATLYVTNPITSFFINDTAQCLKGNNFIFNNNTKVSTGNFTNLWIFGDNNISTAFSPFHSYINAGNYQVILITKSDSGCMDSISKTVSLNPTPVTPLIKDSMGKLISNSGNKWYINDTIILNVNKNFYIPLKSGNYYSTVTINGCNSDSSNNIIILSKPKGANTLCENSYNTVYTADSIKKVEYFDWKINPYYSGIINGTDTFATVDWNDTFTGTSYIKVRGKGRGKFGPYSDSIIISIFSIPPTPFITLNNGKLYSNINSGNQWYLNGVIIPNAQKNLYIPSDSGNYYDIITINGCSSDTSNNIYVKNPLEIKTNNSFTNLNIFPNPLSDVCTIIITDNNKGKYIFSLYSTTGKMIKQETFISNIYEFKKDNLQAGIYLFFIKGNNGVYNGKLVINP